MGSDVRETKVVDGKQYFVANRIVRTLSRTRGIDLNGIWEMYADGLFTLDELKEFYQLIGYSVNGYNELFDEAEDNGE